jgi:hypothetical protein
MTGHLVFVLVSTKKLVMYPAIDNPATTINHLIRPTGDATWVSTVNLETKEQSKQWMHAHSPNKQETITQTLPGLPES